jgi:hypothetical protein
MIKKIKPNRSDDSANEYNFPKRNWRFSYGKQAQTCPKDQHIQKNTPIKQDIPFGIKTQHHIAGQ